MDLPAVVEVLIQFYLVSINTLLAKVMQNQYTQTAWKMWK
jgi:hypothetical protein